MVTLTFEGPMMRVVLSGTRIVSKPSQQRDVTKST